MSRTGGLVALRSAIVARLVRLAQEEIARRATALYREEGVGWLPILAHPEARTTSLPPDTRAKTNRAMFVSPPESA